MIKRHQQISIFVLIFLGLIALFWKMFSAPLPPKEAPVKSVVMNKTPPVIDLKEQTVNGKKVVGLPPGREEEQLKNVQLANTVSDDWEENLEESIREQGGESVKEVIVRKIESIVWIQDGMALNVESAMVTVKDDKGGDVKFRVLVDSQTGKVLKNWDQPILDPSNPRENFGIKVDPRYHQD